VLLIPKRHRQTDGQTDGRLTVASPRSALASRGKNTGSNSSIALWQV